MCLLYYEPLGVLIYITKCARRYAFFSKQTTIYMGYLGIRQYFINFVSESRRVMPRLIDIHTHHPHPEITSPRMAGIHPWNAEKPRYQPDYANCDIVGETGLDYCVPVSREAQRELFEEQLQIAAEMDKPVVIHSVKATEEVLRILAKYPMIRRVVFHGFIGSLQQAETILKRGYYLSFGERSLRSPRTRAVIASMDIDRLFCESDEMPSLSVEEVYSKVAKLREMPLSELVEAVERNYNRFFAKD